MAKETKWETSEKKKKVKVEDKIQRITTREVKVDEKVRVFLIIIERGKRLRLSVNVNQFHVVALSVSQCHSVSRSTALEMMTKHFPLPRRVQMSKQSKHIFSG